MATTSSLNGGELISRMIARDHREPIWVSDYRAE
jgi:hypothetical protein